MFYLQLEVMQSGVQKNTKTKQENLYKKLLNLVIKNLLKFIELN